MLLSPAVLAQSGTSGQHRIIQPIIVNGQSVQGAYITENGMVQSYSCQSPQQYVTADQSQSGWACFDPSSGLWLLHAQPPSSATVPPTQESPNVFYNEPSTTYVPSYSYAYPYYPYSYYGYPYFWGPGLGFAFNFGHGHGFYGGHGFPGGHGFAHGGGGFAHGGFAHGGGFAGHMGGGHR
jgi:hypothetical protein